MPTSGSMGIQIPSSLKHNGFHSILRRGKYLLAECHAFPHRGSTAHMTGGSVAGSPDRVRASWQGARRAVYEATDFH